MGPALGTHPQVAATGPGTHGDCETWVGWDPDAQCGRPARAVVWVQCAVDGPRERGVCADHLRLLDEGVVFRCRVCAADLNLLHAEG